MKLIFLDIDGVLNTNAHSESCVIEDEKLALVAALAMECDARVVLTSSWRLDPNEPWRAKLAEYGISVLGKTPRMNGNNRKNEILSFLEEQTETVDRFVIIDDQRSRWGELSRYLVRTDSRCGITPDKISRAREMLGE